MISLYVSVISANKEPMTEMAHERGRGDDETRPMQNNPSALWEWFREMWCVCVSLGIKLAWFVLLWHKLLSGSSSSSNRYIMSSGLLSEQFCGYHYTLLLTFSYTKLSPHFSGEALMIVPLGISEMGNCCWKKKEILSKILRDGSLAHFFFYFDVVCMWNSSSIMSSSFLTTKPISQW